MIDIKGILDKLASIRPIFHSEADFQHALAWEIHHRYPDSKVRLEYRPPHADSRCYIDIWIKHSDFNYAIELKYKTRGLQLTYDNEKFDLLNQGAQAVGRYDVCKDIQRMEKLTNKDTLGYVIFLTNDQAYWKPASNESTVDSAFRLSEGKHLSGILKWKDEASEGTTKGRKDSIHIKGDYKILWNDYSSLNNLLNNSTYGKFSKFRYLLINTAGKHDKKS